MLLWLFVAAFQVVAALYDVSVDKSSYNAASDEMNVMWSSDGDSAIDKQLSMGKFLMCSYNAENSLTCHELGEGVDLISASSKSFSLTNLTTVAPSGSYIIQMVAVDPDDLRDYFIGYSTSWFTVSGLDGPGEANEAGTPGDQLVGLQTGSSISWSSYTLPESYRSISSYLIPYTWQKGPTRVAPFQPTPNSKVTATSTPSRRYPTSSSSVWMSNRKIEMPVTTLTPSPASTVLQWPNGATGWSVLTGGTKPTRVLPQLSSRQRKRWVD